MLKLLDNEYKVIIVDNLGNSDIGVLQALEQISKKQILFYNIDVRDFNALREIFSNNQIDAVIHFAGFKAVGESMSRNPFLSHYPLWLVRARPAV